MTDQTTPDPTPVLPFPLSKITHAGTQARTISTTMIRLQARAADFEARTKPVRVTAHALLNRLNASLRDARAHAEALEECFEIETLAEPAGERDG